MTVESLVAVIIVQKIGKKPMVMPDLVEACSWFGFGEKAVRPLAQDMIDHGILELDASMRLCVKELP